LIIKLLGSLTIFAFLSNVVLTHCSNSLKNNGLKPHWKKSKSCFAKIVKEPIVIVFLLRKTIQQSSNPAIQTNINHQL